MILLMLVIVMAFCAVLNTTIELVAYRRLRHAPRLAPLITAIGMSFILQNVGLVWKGARPTSVDSILPRGERLHDRRRHVHLGQADRAPLHRSRAARAHLARAADATGKGDARDRPGPGRRRDDGDQRQPDDLVHVLHRRRARRRAGLLYALYFTNIRYDEGFRLGLIAFTAAVLGGIGNLPGAVLGGS